MFLKLPPDMPPDMPWGPLMAWFLCGVVMSAYLLFQDVAREKWVIPTESRLQYASGDFLLRQPGEAYVFQTDGGRRISLGCQPQGFSTDCFDEKRVADDGSHGLSIGYFYVRNIKKSQLSNVLVTVSSANQKFLGYSNRKRQLDDWQRRENKPLRLVFNLALDFLPLIVLCGTAFAGFRARLRRYRLRGPWGEHQELFTPP